VRPDGLYDRPAVFHSTTGLGPRFRRARLIVTIHDLSGITHPEWHPVRTAFLVSQATPSTARDADRVLCDSEFVRRQVVELLGVAEDRTRTQHLSVSSAFMPLDGKAARERLHRRFGLDLPFVLHVGTLEPRKNHVGLIGAFEALRRAGFPGLLVLVGKESWKVKPMLHRIESSPDRSHILRIRDADDHDLRALYSACAMFAFLSLDEGFGLPPLEAMACGTPVVTSNVSSLPEIAGGAALLVDPYDPASIADGITRAVSDERLRAELIERGLARARDFSWAQSVAAVHRIYMEVLDR
jgi:alpha-1,3-rhamnosyl/mannosyltransferase